ncbi:hypothetical protein QJQ45_010896 [Haematococcus lacustris]|nr:hypothetical protein QJQ45_010896 [Haematococcus lacustris]
MAHDSIQPGDMSEVVAQSIARSTHASCFSVPVALLVKTSLSRVLRSSRSSSQFPINTLLLYLRARSWKAGAVRAGFRKVVEQPSRPSTDPRPDRLVIVDEFRTSRVSSSVHARQP